MAYLPNPGILDAMPASAQTVYTLYGALWDLRYNTTHRHAQLCENPESVLASFAANKENERYPEQNAVPKGARGPA